MTTPSMTAPPVTAPPVTALTDDLARPLLGQSRRRLMPAGVAALAVAFALLIALFEAASVHSYPANSDGATVALEGQALSHLRLTLHGWSMTVESFWSIDALFYALTGALLGLRPVILHLTPALIAALVVGVAAALASTSRRGAARVAAVAVVASLLALPSPVLSYYLLQGPWHLATTLWCLLAFSALLSGRRVGWWLAVALTAAGLLGDAITLFIGLAPLGALSLFDAARSERGVRVRAAAPSAGALLASLVLAYAVRALAVTAGAFSLVNRNVPLSAAQIRWNASHVATIFAAMLGVGHLDVGLSPGPFGLQLLHLVGLGLVVVGVVASAAALAGALATRTARSAAAPRRLDALLLGAFFGDVVTFVALSPTSNPTNNRYLLPAVVSGVILAARRLGELVEAQRPGPSLRIAAVVGVLLASGFALDEASFVEGPAPVQRASALASFLRAHHLVLGIGDYWSASIVTVESSGSVAVRPVTNNTHGQLLRYDRQSSTSWYKGRQFQFFVYDTARPWRHVNATTASATFGPPAHVYDVGSYRVLVWHHPVSVAAQLPAESDPIRLYWRL